MDKHHQQSGRRARTPHSLGVNQSIPKAIRFIVIRIYRPRSHSLLLFTIHVCDSRWIASLVISAVPIPMQNEFIELSTAWMSRLKRNNAWSTQTQIDPHIIQLIEHLLQFKTSLFHNYYYNSPFKTYSAKCTWISPSATLGLLTISRTVL